MNTKHATLYFLAAKGGRTEEAGGAQLSSCKPQLAKLRQAGLVVAIHCLPQVVC